MGKWKKYLLWFAQEHIEFRLCEIESLVSMLNINMRFLQTPKFNEPFWLVEFQCERDAVRLSNRSVSLKSCVELWAHSENVEQLHKNLQEMPPVDLYQIHFRQDRPFKIQVESFNKHLSLTEKLEKLQAFHYLPVEGPVNLSRPDLILQYIEYYGNIPSDAARGPFHVFFGRWIANGLRQLIQSMSLKTRKFIGNTSMDPQLSLLMANQAQIQEGDIVLDPFVGSGSVLVAAAQFGAYVLGGDIDFLMLHGRTRPSRIRQTKRSEDENIRANMRQYGLEQHYLDVVVVDFATDVWKSHLEIDCIITDPPYGIREAKERVGTTTPAEAVQEQYRNCHYPKKVEYRLIYLYNDLLSFAARHLKLGGRLVCWFPVCRTNTDTSHASVPILPEQIQDSLDFDGKVPEHPALRLISSAEQTLSRSTARKLLTYEKSNGLSRNIASDAIVESLRQQYYASTVGGETSKKDTLRDLGDVVHKSGT